MMVKSPRFSVVSFDETVIYEAGCKNTLSFHRESVDGRRVVIEASSPRFRRIPSSTRNYTEVLLIVPSISCIVTGKLGVTGHRRVGSNREVCT